jgi:extracellular factor (EF) 3-hydroxypalmitic acid methyl ester biosynthesis protein
LSAPIECSFFLEDEPLRIKANVIDVSSTGLAIQPTDEGVGYTSGTRLRELVISHREETLFNGTGSVVYHTTERVGIRTNSLIDLQSVQVREAVEGRGLLQNLTTLRNQFATLPTEWRAAVGDLANLLQSVRASLDELEEEAWGSKSMDRVSADRFLRHILLDWSDLHLDKLRDLHRLSRSFNEHQTELGRFYAETLLTPLYLHGALYKRATTKPRGYAGDYLTMLLFNEETPVGDTLFERFVDLASKQHSLSTTALTRQRSVTERVLQSIDRGGKKIVSLASGPATELGVVIDGLHQEVEGIELVLVDQDDEALAFAHDFLLRRCLERGFTTSQIRIICIHFSVRQILKPTTQEELDILEQVLKGSDFIYSMGLLDYLPDPVASRLIHALYALLGRAGELYIGNLVEAEDSTWLMDFVLAWHLVWRDPPNMRELASSLVPKPKGLQVNLDSTGKCLFLEVHAP